MAVKASVMETKRSWARWIYDKIQSKYNHKKWIRLYNVVTEMAAKASRHHTIRFFVGLCPTYCSCWNLQETFWWKKSETKKTTGTIAQGGKSAIPVRKICYILARCSESGLTWNSLSRAYLTSFVPANKQDSNKRL